jgi:CheY-specific phosphatase CheX
VGTCLRVWENAHQLRCLAQSGIAELANVITGRASVKLSQAGYEATISPPQCCWEEEQLFPLWITPGWLFR